MRSVRKTVAEGMSQLSQPEAKRFVSMFRHGSLEVELYAPRGSDHQQPHSRDEAYVVVQGHGIFMHDGKRDAIQAGDFLFVEAGVEHCFEDFSDDLAVWVIFSGPEGGEKSYG